MCTDAKTNPTGINKTEINKWQETAITCLTRSQTMTWGLSTGWQCAVNSARTHTHARYRPDMLLSTLRTQRRDYKAHWRLQWDPRRTSQHPPKETRPGTAFDCNNYILFCGCDLMDFFIAYSCCKEVICSLTQIMGTLSSLSVCDIDFDLSVTSLCLLAFCRLFFAVYRISMWPTSAAVGVTAWRSVLSCTHICLPTSLTKSSWVEIR